MYTLFWTYRHIILDLLTDCEIQNVTWL